MINDSEIECLKIELEHEKTYREAAAWSNGELERRAVLLQQELAREGGYPWEGDEELAREGARHRTLHDGNRLLLEQLPQLRENIRSAKICGADCKLKHDDLNINLDVLTQKELLRVVKKFERLKTDLISTIRSKEWRMDSESKLLVRLSDQRTYLQNELLACRHTLQRDTLQNMRRAADNRTADTKQATIKKIPHNDKLPPIMA